ncbi:hypothetical protein GOC16_08505 [Sinorhizobium meliloti]|nr:hypothetical protein [Sinorhizobium meliloti]
MTDITQEIIDRIVPAIGPVSENFVAEWDLWQDRKRIREELAALIDEPTVFASRHNDETGECEPVEIDPPMLAKLRDRASRIRSCLLDKPEAVEGVTPERAARVLYDNWSGLNALPSPARELASQGHFFSALRLIFEPNADLRRPPAPAALTQEPTHE